MCDVSFGEAARIALEGAGHEVGRFGDPSHMTAADASSQIALQQIEKIGDACAVFDGETAIHKRFAELQLRMQSNLCRDTAVVKLNRNRRLAYLTEVMRCAARIDDRQVSLAND